MFSTTVHPHHGYDLGYLGDLPREYSSQRSTPIMVTISVTLVTSFVNIHPHPYTEKLTLHVLPDVKPQELTT